MHLVSPKCVKLVTSSNFWQFVLISALFLLVLLVMILLFSALTSALLCPCSVYQSVGQVSKFSIAAAHKVDVVGES